jgi:hypothetical protein
MVLVQEKDVAADLGQVTEGGVQSPEPTQDHDDHEHGFEIVDFLRVLLLWRPPLQSGSVSGSHFTK